MQRVGFLNELARALVLALLVECLGAREKLLLLLVELWSGVGGTRTARPTAPGHHLLPEQSRGAAVSGAQRGGAHA